MQLTQDHSSSIISNNSTPTGLSIDYSTREMQSNSTTGNMFPNMSQDAINQAFLNQQLASQQQYTELLSGSNVLPQGLMLIDTPTLPSHELMTQSKVIIHDNNLENLINSGESTPSGGLSPQEHVVSSMMHLSSHGGFHTEGSNLIMTNNMMNPISNEQQFFENMLTSTNTQNAISNSQNMLGPDNLPLDPPRSVPSMPSNAHMPNVFANNNMMNFDMCLSQVPRKHSVRSNRPAHLRHGYSKSVSMFTPPNQSRPSGSQYCMSNLKPTPNPHFMQPMPSERIPPSFQKQMVENSQMLHAMRKKMGHRRQYSAPELKYSGYPRSPEKQLLRQTTEGQMLRQRGYMQMSPMNQVSPNDLHGLTPEQIEALTLHSQGDPEQKPLKILEYTADGYGVLRPNSNSIINPVQDFKYRGHTFPYKSGSVDDLPDKQKLKSLDNLTREELIKRLRNVENELAKTKHSPTKSPNLMADFTTSPCGETSSEQGDEPVIADSLSPTGADISITHAYEEKLAEEDEEDEELDDEDDIKGDKDDEKFEKPQIFDCLWNDCSKSFPALDVLISHIGQEHIGSGKASYKCEWQGCPRNQKPFTKRHKMYNHLRTHTGERPFQCPVAGTFN
ncbi:hypothetical protein K7432_015685 [Basidiobolus ranarum]|uniref:C2H2-type domain-containing protein n=1 Tax=Basidiobolus ranarum TaxID=34480 RepID=A0ABR2VNV2_9FUNG